MSVDKIKLLAPDEFLVPELQAVLQTLDSGDFAIDFDAAEAADALIVHASRFQPDTLPEENLILFGTAPELAALEAAPQIVAAVEWPSCPVAIQRSLRRSAAWLRRERQLRALAYTDGLTGLLNRRGFDDQGARCIARARFERQPSAVLLIDLDHFKQVNDRHGHAAGDAVLRHVGGLIPTMVRACDVVGRIGGEEIAIIMPGMSPEAARASAERLRAAIAETSVDVDGKRLRVTASIGIGSTGTAGDHVAAMRQADAALYEAKGQGRNRVIEADASRPWNVAASLPLPSLLSGAPMFAAAGAAAF